MDVHVDRIAVRLGWAPETPPGRKNRTPEDTRKTLETWLPPTEWVRRRCKWEGSGEHNTKTYRNCDHHQLDASSERRSGQRARKRPAAWQFTGPITCDNRPSLILVQREKLTESGWSGCGGTLFRRAACHQSSAGGIRADAVHAAAAQVRRLRRKPAVPVCLQRGPLLSRQEEEGRQDSRKLRITRKEASIDSRQESSKAQSMEH